MVFLRSLCKKRGDVFVNHGVLPKSVALFLQTMVFCVFYVKDEERPERAARL